MTSFKKGFLERFQITLHPHGLSCPHPLRQCFEWLGSSYLCQRFLGAYPNLFPSGMCWRPMGLSNSQLTKCIPQTSRHQCSTSCNLSHSAAHSICPCCVGGSFGIYIGSKGLIHVAGRMSPMWTPRMKVQAANHQWWGHFCSCILVR